MDLYMKNRIVLVWIALVLLAGCKTAMKTLEPEPYVHDKYIAPSYQQSLDTANVANVHWRDFFNDRYLNALIDTALQNNLDLKITLQDIEIAKNRILYRQGLLKPTVVGGGTLGLEKVGRYTSQGAGDASADITPGKRVPELLGDFYIGARASWELDAWKKLRNGKKAAIAKYMATQEGKNFVITNMIAEIANSYYELLSLDNTLDIIHQTITLQKNALEIVKVQKDAAVVTELAVKKFEADVLNTQSLEYDILQKITEAENRINFILGRFAQPVPRDKSAFNNPIPAQIKAGIPSQLLANRPDIKQAEAELFATECDVKAAKAEFYPSFNISGALGFQAFNPVYLVRLPESILTSIVADAVAPLVNRSAIQSEYNTAKAVQVQAMYDYQLRILRAYVEVSNELSNLNNLTQYYEIKSRQAETLNQSISIANDLFKSGRADYLEVLLSQRDVLDTRLELVEAKKKQFLAMTDLYKALGGGWK